MISSFLSGCGRRARQVLAGSVFLLSFGYGKTVCALNTSEGASPFQVSGDIQLKLVTLDELPVDGGFKLPETTYSDVVSALRVSWQPTPDVIFRSWLKTEFRNYVKNRSANRYRFLDEIVFHELSVEFTDLMSDRLDLKIGRFPMHYGRGLQILESSPLDAERSYGFNGIRGRFKFAHYKLDLIGIYSPEEDEYLINNKHKKIGFLESDERGVVAYLTSNDKSATAGLPSDIYYMFKHERPRFGQSDVYLHTLGFIWPLQWTEQFSSYWELARQGGHRRGGGDVRAWLSDFSMNYQWPDKAWQPEVFFANYYLSGDDPATSTEENWHGLWARWPQYSYFLVWQFIPRIGDWTNINWSRLGLRLRPGDRTRFEMSIGPVYAPEKGLGGGDHRGNLLIAILNHRFTSRFSVMARAEFFESGDFHPEQDNLSWEARVQFKYEF